MMPKAYKDLLSQYLAAPAGSMARKALSPMLAGEEKLLLHYPPLALEGVITPEEARAQAATPEDLKTLEQLDMPRGPRIRDEFTLIPTREWSDALQQKKQDDAMNRGLVKHTLNQGSNGSCASEGISGCVMGTEAKGGEMEVGPLNAFALYRLVNGGRDGGSSLSDNIAAARKYGIPTEQVWPRSHGWRKKPTEEVRQDALRHRPDEMFRVSDKQEFGTALLLGFPVYAGYSGHAWFAVDLLDEERFVWKNSWGDDWADNGFSTLQFSRVYWGYGCWAIRTVRRATDV